jgi:Protein of unknown function (DUF2510)
VTISGAAVSPGWYTDPGGSPALRWWDGNQWTDHTQPIAPPRVVAAPIAPPPVPQTATAYNPAMAPGTYYTSRAPSVAVSNTVAWIGLVAGIAAVVAIFLKFAAPSAGVYLPVFGLTAIIASIRAIARYRRGSVTVLWAPIVGLVLGGVAELLLLTLIAISAVANTGALAGSSGSHVALGPPAGSTINYSMGQGGLQYLPTGNPTLSDAAMQETALVTQLKAEYGPGKYPSALHLDSSGDVIASDGTVLGNYLGQGWFIDYVLESDGSYLLEISAQPTDEVAVYFSITDEYWAWCGTTDATCETASPVPPSTSQTPSMTSGSAGDT